MPHFYRKPGKIGATTREVWVGVLMRRRGMADQAATREVDAMIADGRLVLSAD